VNNGIPSTFTNSFAFSGTNVFAGTYSGVFLSSDNGSSWTVKNNGLANLFVSSMVTSGTSIYSGSYYGGIYLSTNGGTSWAKTNNGLPAQDLAISRVVMSGSSMVACTEMPDRDTAKLGLFLSVNNGVS
jgi:photosystem II stability/assembly factor-like uncharacterized protein